jgi:hypothetical protein
MLPDTLGNFELIHFLSGNLFGMRAHHEMNLVGGAIDLLKQSLQIDCSAGASRCNDKLHGQKNDIGAGCRQGTGRLVLGKLGVELLRPQRPTSYFVMSSGVEISLTLSLRSTMVRDFSTSVEMTRVGQTS